MRAAVALAALGLAFGSAAMPAGAQEVGDDSEVEVLLPEAYLDGYGWWSKTQQNPAGGQTVPAQPCTPNDVNQCPAGPPADGIYVVYDYEVLGATAVTGPIGNAPTPALPGTPSGVPAPNLAAPEVIGPTAYGAVRFIVPEGAETQLSLKVLSRSSTTPGGVDPNVGRLFACQVASPGWAAIQNGRYDQAPTYDCSTADEATFNGDVAVFDLPSGMVTNGTIDVAIVGAGVVSPDSPNERPFQIALAAPTNDSLLIVNADELAEEFVDFSEEDFTFEDPLTEFEASTFVDSAFSGELAYSSDPSLLPSVGPSASRPVTRRAVPAGRVVNPFGPDASRGERILAVSLLMSLGFGLWWVGGMAPRAPRLLGSLGNGKTQDVVEDPLGGIGRFQKTRVGRPKRLF